MKGKNVPKDFFSIVPWRSPEEFNNVYKYLFSDNLSEKQLAVDQIAVWNAYCHPSLPTAIESTVVIIRAVIQDNLYQAEKSLCQEGDIQMLYCMALIRFVNLTLEHHQNAPGKIRMSVLAAKNNIPLWLLDLRNEAVHSYCPSLSMLRMGAESALQYLKEKFWEKEAPNRKAKVIHPVDLEPKITALINQYKSIQFQRMEGPGSALAFSKDLKAVLRKISHCIFHHREKFIDTLVKPGNFISGKDLKKLIRIDDVFVADDHLHLPIKVQKFWKPLINNIHNKDLMQVFLEKLLQAQENCRIKICQKTAVAWILLIFKGVASRSTFSSFFQKKGLHLYIPPLITACLKSASFYSEELLSTFLSKCKKKKLSSNLFTLLAIYRGYLVDEDSSQKRKRGVNEIADLDKVTFTIEDVEKVLEERRIKKMRCEKDCVNEENKSESESVNVENEDINAFFLPSSSLDYSNIPIGANLYTKESSDVKKQLDDPRKKPIKLEPSLEDDFIIVNKNDDKGTVEEITDSMLTLDLKNFDMLYRDRPN